MTICYAGDSHYKVREKLGTYTLVLNKGTCDCKVQDMSGILCMHVCAEIQMQHGNVESFVHYYYSKKAWAKAYSGIIFPIPDSLFWPNTPYTGLLPPEHTCQPGKHMLLTILILLYFISLSYTTIYYFFLHVGRRKRGLDQTMSLDAKIKYQGRG